MENERSSSTPANAAAPTAAPDKKPLLYNGEYYSFLETSIHGLQNDYTSGAREMASNALANLATLIKTAATTARDRDELWRMAVDAAKELCCARPAMSAAITSTLLRALSSIQVTWDADESEKSTSDLARIACDKVDSILEERKEAGKRLAQTFADWVLNMAREDRSMPGHTHTLTLLTLSNSSTLSHTILSLLTDNPTLTLHLILLESRPNYEASTLSAQLLSSLSSARAVSPFAEASRLRITLAPDCSAASLMYGVDAVLLGADRIEPDGGVWNKMGSAAVAVIAKVCGKKVGVISMQDKIFASPSETSKPTGTTSENHPGAKNGGKGWIKFAEPHPHDEITSAYPENAQKVLRPYLEGSDDASTEAGDKRASDTNESENDSITPSASASNIGPGNTSNTRKLDFDGEREKEKEKDLGVEVFNYWFEKVPARFVDAYVTEGGILDAEEVKRIAHTVEELRGRVFA